MGLVCSEKYQTWVNFFSSEKTNQNTNQNTNLSKQTRRKKYGTKIDAI